MKSLETLRVTILGAGGSDPPPGYAGPSILVEDGGVRLLLDCGEGCMERLRRFGYSPCDIDAVYITHRHIDHWAGVFPLSVARTAEGCRRLVVYAHRVVAEELGGVLGSWLPRSVELVLRGVEESFELGELRVRLVEVSHTAPTFAAAVALGGEYKLLYTGDTRLDESVVERLSGLGAPRVLLGEATFPSGREELAAETGHMTVSQVLELRDALGAELLVPVHLTPSSLRQLLAYRRMPRGILVPLDSLALTV